ncbi:MAG: hypothetical protein LBO62_01145 [Endomicrobium sp.]|jgi:uncharacterized membrane protein YcgQ (UPF0703/DUF1980 family)|nr:hypothetical protein [Endomicrobium sp.]
MKKISVIAVAVIIGCSVIFGSKKSPLLADQNGVLEIRDRLFAAQVNDVYKNAKDYIGKTIKYQGVFGRYVEDASDVKNYYVIRYGPGCCGNDAYIGFEVVLDGDKVSDKDYPAENEWVEAVGKVEEYDFEGIKVLRIRLSSLKILQERGKEFITV